MDAIKQRCFDILIEIDKVCKAANLQYFIYAGTLLGAVRHHGFIPWDDDIDIVMMRKDYVKFPAACEKWLNHDKYELQTIYSDPKASNEWMKLHDKNTAFISGIRREGAMEGINIDIFPIDNAPDNTVVQNVRGKIIDCINFMYQWRFCYHSKTASWKMRCFQAVVSIIPPWNEMHFKKAYERYLQRYNKFKTENVVYFSNRRYQRKIISRHVFDTVEMMEFEDSQFPAPGGWKEVLEGLYGKNYMKLPPIDQQVTVHGTQVIDLDHSWREYRRGPNGYEKI